VQAPVTVNTDVPEPSSVGLLLSALLGSGLLWVRRYRV
jgi:hypothetical protein